MHMPPPKNLTICLKIKKILTLAARLPASIGQNKPRTAGAFLVLRQFFRIVRINTNGLKHTNPQKIGGAIINKQMMEDSREWLP